MSYDIRFGVKAEGVDEIVVIGQPENDSPTYNLREMFVACMDWDYKQGEWYRVSEVLPKFERGLHELRFNSKAYKKYEPDNGWGSIYSAVECLQSVIEKTQFYVEGHGWNQIPLEALWIAW